MGLETWLQHRAEDQPEKTVNKLGQQRTRTGIGVPSTQLKSLSLNKPRKEDGCEEDQGAGGHNN